MKTRSFDAFGEQLFEEAKSFLEESKTPGITDSMIQAFLHASLLLGMSSLEAYVNSVIDEVCSTEEYGIDFYMKSVLTERQIKIDKGVFFISDELKMSRTIDKIEVLVSRFSTREDRFGDWSSNLKEAINLRNKLVHPKETIDLSVKSVEKALNSILEAVNQVFLAVYKVNVPIYRYGVTVSRLSP